MRDSCPCVPGIGRGTSRRARRAWAPGFVIAALFVGPIGCSGECDLPDAPPPADTAGGRWHQDVEYLGKALPVCHTNPFFKTSQTTFQHAIDDLGARVDTLSPAKVIVGMARVVAMIGDGHTSLRFYPELTGFRRVPLRFQWYGSDLYVTDATAANAGARGRRVTAIGDGSVAEAKAAVDQVISHDNAFALLDQDPEDLVVGDVLAALDVTKDPGVVRFHLDDPGGGPPTVLDLDVVSDPSSIAWLSAGDTPLPLYRRSTDRNYWYTYLDGQRALYMQYNYCGEAADKSMSDFAAELFQTVDSHPVDRMIIDMRHNPGGNSSVIDPIVEGIKSRSALQQHGRLFVVVGRGTYSSAVNNATTLRDEAGAIIVGEPSGGKPRSYGNVKSFRLPNSKLIVTYSTKFIDISPDETDALYPQLPVQGTIEDYLGGADPVLDAALTDKP